MSGASAALVEALVEAMLDFLPWARSDEQHDEARDRLDAIVAAARAEGLDVETLARALNDHDHTKPVPDGYQRLIVRRDHLGPWLTDDCPARIAAAYREAE